ncbi:MAG: DegV family EDD domain-containing protein [Gammaproteobacteria bacterium]|nr:DegV family EDD domain-containing protein [Gammaproteobacteria bacterium]
MKGIHYLDGRRLARAITAGMQQLQNSREELDRINVFPVADGDTGLNMAHTAQAVILALAESPSRSAAEVAQAAARGALYGARGNSGVILAQFLQGLADAWEGKARLDTRDVALGLTAAAESARNGLSNPREGTILSVMSAVGIGALNVSPEGELTALLSAAREAADNAVQKTPEQLEVLRRAGVVDAGGAGLAHLLGGIEKLVKTGRGADAGEFAGAARALAGTARAHDLGEESEFRYCTECMISGEGLKPADVREEIQTLGDSVVVAGGARIVRLHIHTDRPHEVFAVAHEHGEVSSEKADDMHVQFALLNGSRVPIGCDSGADIPAELVRDLRITTAPLRIHVGEKGYLDGLGLPPDWLWQAMEDHGEKAQTATPPRGDMERVMSFLAGHFPESVWITLAGSVSGTADVARSVASELTGGKVRVVDSVNVSIGHGLVIQHAAEWARAGAGADEIVASLPPLLESARTFGVIEDLSHGVRGGRISPRIKQLSDLLKVDALLGISRHGTVKACGVQRRSGDRVKRFARYVLKRFPTDQPLRIAVAHANRPESGHRLHEMLAESVPNLVSSYVTELGAVVSAHAGPGALLAAAIPALPLRPPPEARAA